MRGKQKYIQAQDILNKLYKKDYMVNDKILSKDTLYKIYLSFLRKSAYLGFPEAQYDLGQTYEDYNFWGENPNYSFKKCIYWYKKACKQGVPAAYNNLAGFYENGDGVIKDIQKALELYKKAYELGDINGKKNYKLLLKQLKQEKLDRGE